MKKVLVEAKKAGWTHLPEHDRYIADQVTFAFSKDNGENNNTELDLMFDLCEMDVVTSGVARWMNRDGVRIVSGKDIIFVEIEDFFNPEKMLHYGKGEKM
jgi:hypothetical protein